MALIVRTFHLLALGVAIGLIGGFTRGFPTARTQQGDDATCSAPLPTQPTVQWIKATEAEPLLNNPDVRFVDARPAQAYQSGHIASAIHVPLRNGTIDEASLAKIRGAKTIIAYCDTNSGCAASRRVAGILSASGFSDVRVLEGGIHAWLDQNYPAEAGACPDCP